METIASIEDLERQVAAARGQPGVLVSLVDPLLVTLKATATKLATLEARVAELEGRPKAPAPPWAKANTKKPAEGEKKTRRKRGVEQNGARRRQEPTRIVEHHVDQCVACGCRLSAQTLGWIRQVEDIPPPPPVEV